MIELNGCHFQDEIINPNVKRSNFVYNSTELTDLCLPNMQEIIPGVFLGSYSAAQLHCISNLMANGIRYIICVRQDLEAEFIRPQINDPSFTYLTLNIADQVTENIIRFFPKVKNFIDEALSKNFKVLVHGNNGNSRSAALVLAYIMEKFGMELNDALRLVKEKRASVNPNEGFCAQLTEYEPIYKARQILNNGEPSSNRSRQKRKSEDLDFIDNDNTVLIQPPPSPISLNNYNNTEQEDLSNDTICDIMKHFCKSYID